MAFNLLELPLELVREASTFLDLPSLVSFSLASKLLQSDQIIKDLLSALSKPSLKAYSSGFDTEFDLHKGGHLLIESLANCYLSLYRFFAAEFRIFHILTSRNEVILVLKEVLVVGDWNLFKWSLELCGRQFDFEAHLLEGIAKSGDSKLIRQFYEERSKYVNVTPYHYQDLGFFLAARGRFDLLEELLGGLEKEHLFEALRGALNEGQSLTYLSEKFGVAFRQNLVSALGQSLLDSVPMLDFVFETLGSAEFESSVNSESLFYSWIYKERVAPVQWWLSKGLALPDDCLENSLRFAQLPIYDLLEPHMPDSKHFNKRNIFHKICESNKLAVIKSYYAENEAELKDMNFWQESNKAILTEALTSDTLDFLVSKFPPKDDEVIFTFVSISSTVFDVRVLEFILSHSTPEAISKHFDTSYELASIVRHAAPIDYIRCYVSKFGFKSTTRLWEAVGKVGFIAPLEFLLSQGANGPRLDQANLNLVINHAIGNGNLNVLNYIQTKFPESLRDFCRELDISMPCSIGTFLATIDSLAWLIDRRLLHPNADLVEQMVRSNDLYLPQALEMLMSKGCKIDSDMVGRLETVTRHLSPCHPRLSSGREYINM